MYERIFRYTALVWLACRLSLPNPVAFAKSLREEAAAYRMQGYEAHQRGDRDAALMFYQKAAALDPTYPAPQNDMGILLEAEGRLDEAERAYQQALVIDPGYLEAHANLALLYERSGKKDLAVTHWIKRYQLGEPHDLWTKRAEEHLMAHGVLNEAGVKGQLFTRRRLVEQELESHATTLKEFESVTEPRGPWY
jgi:tetratricopeptide (TPR) repeat protein